MKICTLLLSFFLVTWSLNAHTGQGVSQPTYSSDVAELLNECKDIPLEAPVINEPSALEVFGRTWGIYLAYKLYELRYAIGIALLCATCYRLKSPATH